MISESNTDRPELYFKNDREWRAWLHANHDKYTGVYLIFYKVASINESMRWEEAVQVALCYGWIDSTVKKLDNERRKQLFTPRKPKSVWSKLNKSYIQKLQKSRLMQKSGQKSIDIAKENGSWTALDDVENLVVPEDLQDAFDQNPKAFENYKKFSFTYQKSYLYWLHTAKRRPTRIKRILEIITLCTDNIKKK